MAGQDHSCFATTQICSIPSIPTSQIFRKPLHLKALTEFKVFGV
jgi:hypothetical protein